MGLQNNTRFIEMRDYDTESYNWPLHCPPPPRFMPGGSSVPLSPTGMQVVWLATGWFQILNTSNTKLDNFVINNGLAHTYTHGNSTTPSCREPVLPQSYTDNVTCGHRVLVCSCKLGKLEDRMFCTRSASKLDFIGNSSWKSRTVSWKDFGRVEFFQNSLANAHFK